MSDEVWVDVAAEAEITPSHPVVLRQGRRRLAVLRNEAGELWAVDDRCPHEGYPLAQGQLRGCTLTCAWHNFKFDLRDGRCLKGDESVAVYPVRVVDGRVQVDARPPADEGAKARGLQRLAEGMLERRLGQIARELTRLLDAGMDARMLALEAARFDAERAEYGTTHALAVATDLLPLLPRYPGTRAVLPLMQVFDLVSESHVRRPLRPVAAPIDPGDDPVAAGRRLRALVEQEEGEQAEGLLRGALAKGWGRAELEPWLFGPCCDHFLSFGHPLIYQGKLFELLEAVGWEHAQVLLPAHLRGIVDATREDTLPRWQSFVRRLAEHEDALPRWWAAAPRAGTAAELPRSQREAWWRALVDGERDEAFDAIAEALQQGAAPTAIADVIAAAAAERMLRFELAVERDPTVQEGWLDVSHTLTFAAAVHHAVGRYDDPSVLRLLFQAARFVNNARTLDASPAPTGLERGCTPGAEPVTLQALDAAITARDPEAAVALASGYLAAHGPDEALRHAAEDLPLRDLYTRPIVVAHAIKVARVAFEVAARLQHTAWAELPILALVRFGASPHRERAVGQLAHEAERLVVEGKVPHTRT
ncbi:Rieske 2Fe-2S domain-containing protein [Paraliomyxa miuraensis]|uniref:Rieske 2Fe-2S domain-containing protein n=1 Tax=Paraliomyxa miuraensis TaxID=376150 RepID=UPI002259C016|nr:Rieske 2Fe-2S domain-containing protein [Paraliomyxa miuraensis]MCX4240320.1 Rieske 2Fe-2S domain-containing protein [Paraliomyxa miuraensis]